MDCVNVDTPTVRRLLNTWPIQNSCPYNFTELASETLIDQKHTPDMASPPNRLVRLLLRRDTLLCYCKLVHQWERKYSTCEQIDREVNEEYLQKTIFPAWKLCSSPLFFPRPSFLPMVPYIFFRIIVLGRVTAHFPPLSNAFADKAYCSRVSLISKKKSESSLPIGKALLWVGRPP